MPPGCTPTPRPSSELAGDDHPPECPDLLGGTGQRPFAAPPIGQVQRRHALLIGRHQPADRTIGARDPAVLGGKNAPVEINSLDRGFVVRPPPLPNARNGITTADALCLKVETRPKRRAFAVRRTQENLNLPRSSRESLRTPSRLSGPHSQG